jgi:hypothetical protein
MRKPILTVLALLAVFAACKSAPPKPGDKCKTEGVGSCPDPKHFLVCRGGVQALDNCLGANGCAVVGTSVKCDQSIAAIGDACSVAGGAACSPDSKQFLKCDGTKIVLDADCKGPAGCSHVGTQVKCDESVGAAGDVCSDEGKAACSVDTKSFLKCTAKKLAVTATCGGPKGCFIQGTEVHCDESLGEDGDLCTDPKGHACSHDKKHMLECKDGKLHTAKACKKSCDLKDDQIFCN